MPQESAGNDTRAHALIKGRSVSIDAVLCSSLNANPPTQGTLHFHVALGLCLILVALITFGFTHNWIFAKLQAAFPAMNSVHSHLPVVGFVGMLGSFATCFSAKRIAGKIAQSVRIYLLR